MFLLFRYYMTAGKIVRELWWTNQEFSPVNLIIPPQLSILIYHLGDADRPVGGRSSETLSYPIDMNNKARYIHSTDLCSTITKAAFLLMSRSLELRHRRW
jgi:hypothetical protein